MKPTLKAGVTARERILVDRDRTIGFLGESARVYSTPAMVRDIEYCSLKLLQEHLDEGESSVGIHVSVDHLAATPLDRWVELELTVVNVDGRKVTIEAKVEDIVEQVGRGEAGGRGAKDSAVDGTRLRSSDVSFRQACVTSRRFAG